MSQPRMISATAPTLAMNRVLRNTYALLALTLLFSAFTAGLSMVFNWPYPGLILTSGWLFRIAVPDQPVP